MAPWRETLFAVTARNVSNRVEDFALPEERAVLMGQQIRF